MQRTSSASKTILSRSAVLLLFALIAGACGGNTVEEPESDESDFGSTFGSGGGGGVLVFDGEEIPISSAVCVIDGDMFDVGTISDSGHRVLISRTNPLNATNVQILDPDFLQWFPEGVSGDEAQRDGGVFTSEPATYFNNNDDLTVEASFRVECP